MRSKNRPILWFRSAEAIYTDQAELWRGKAHQRFVHSCTPDLAMISECEDEWIGVMGAPNSKLSRICTVKSGTYSSKSQVHCHVPNFTSVSENSRYVSP